MNGSFQRLAGVIGTLSLFGQRLPQAILSLAAILYAVNAFGVLRLIPTGSLCLDLRYPIFRGMVAFCRASPRFSRRAIRC